jgi:hypothetical protein
VLQPSFTTNLAASRRSRGRWGFMEYGMSIRYAGVMRRY